ncbi:MAG TPA: class I adenylate-forming enzyme family protein [Actinocrinis sp.]|nr:class I adenylate-forming enzyme family protein [Actinocrinis sp.]
MNAAPSGPATPAAPAPGHRVDALLLAGDDHEHCLTLGRAVDRGSLRALVEQAGAQLARAGLAEGGTVALRLPPSLALVTGLLAGWRLGAQVLLLDHRLTRIEVDRALDRLAPQVLVEPAGPAGTALRGYAEVETVAVARPGGRPAEQLSPGRIHALVQLSSGSTGPSKVVARTLQDLAAELDRYSRLPQFPRRGERIVLLSSLVHVLGLVGGLLWSLHAGVELVLPERLTAAGILAAVTAGPQPTTVIGVPFYAELLAAAAAPGPLPSFARMIVAGELVRPGVPEAFTARYGIPLGTMYGMTELGVIATDLTGRLRPALDPAHGLDLRVDQGELHIKQPDSPYLGEVDPACWSDGWLHTRDAATKDPATGQVVILGRRDSQVSIGGLKVDLTEVERTLSAVDGVAEAVVVFEAGGIEAYLVLEDGANAAAVREDLALEVAAYKLPRHLRALPALPRTATGKLLRDPAALREAAAAETRAAQARAAAEPAPDARVSVNAGDVPDLD